MTRLLLLAAIVFGAAASGCTPSIGDKCVLSTDCSLQGDRTCDTSQPGGYCTMRDCRANTCPDQAACVLYEPTVPGCGFDVDAPSRVGRSYCMAHCDTDADCRGGYRCVDPKGAPWFAVILDDDIGKHVCIWDVASGGTSPSGPVASTQPPPVCQAIGPDAGAVDAQSFYDAGAHDASSDASTDGASDAADGGDASDAGAGDSGSFDAAEGG